VTQLEDRVTPSNAPFQVDRPTGLDFFTATASDGQGNSVFVYNSINTNTWTFDVDAQIINAQGGAVGNPILVNAPSDGDHMQPSVAEAPDGRFVITWFGDGLGANGGCYVYAKEFNANGSADGSEFQVATYPGDSWVPAPTVQLIQMAISPSHSPDRTIPAASSRKFGSSAGICNRAVG
jgi:large repetitive protein